jgi:hypothetical protein
MLRLLTSGVPATCDPWVELTDEERVELRKAINSHFCMPNLKVGDTISCRVKTATIVSPYKNYDEIKSFLIVAVDENGYYLFVPCYYLLKNSFIADKYKIKSLGIENKFLNEEITYIQDNMVASIDSIRSGISCKICREHFPYAEANQEDGTMICFSCHQNPYR